MIDYRLVVLTNGRPCLRETLEAFRQHASPGPVEVVLVDDGGSQSAQELVTPWNEVPAVYRPIEPARGFCGATAAAWKLAGERAPLTSATRAVPDYVFWLEEDFVLQRKLDLTQLAEVIDVEPTLAQMALYRQPVSDEEQKVGGYLNIPGREYSLRSSVVEPDTAGSRFSEPWLEHQHYWTTNPSLFRRSVAEYEHWPLDSECEGKFGIELRRRGHTFGIWGAGEVWVRHVAERSGWGY